MQSDLRTQVNATRPLKWTAGIDWYRFIVDRLSDIPLARDRADYLQWEDSERASAVKPWKFQGFEGWASDRIRYGIRGGKLLWEASGSQAASTRALMGEFGGYCSRIDLQTTLCLSSGQPEFGTSCLGFKPGTSHPLHSPRTPTGLSVSSSGLWLGTVGRRTCPSYWRLYDKGVEAKCAPKGVMWRLELECKGQHSRSLACRHQKELASPMWCARYLAQRWKSSGYSWPSDSYIGERLEVDLIPKEPTTAARLALWLSHSVSPVVPRLLTVFTVAEVLEMLKLSAVAAPIGKVNAQRGAAKHVGPRPA
jgi:hypothetical protein